ncbi:MAG: metallophosphoesterase [Alistipes sp.]|nr:metallophosphoesterase [Candidatus Alistipes equi]
MKKIVFALICVFVSVGYSYAQEKISIEIQPYLQNLSDTEVTIVWKSSLESVGWVEIAPHDGNHFYYEKRPQFFDAQNGIKNVSKIHRVQVTDLKPGTRYDYRVFSRHVTSREKNKVYYGNVASTKVYRHAPLSFTTPSKDISTFRFAMVNDIHGNSKRMETLLSAAGLDSLDLVIFNGDMVSIFDSEQTVFEGFMTDAIRLFASEKPMYYTRGNHETRGVLAPSFKSYFSPYAEAIYYAFRWGDTCFVVLDTGEDKPDSDIEYWDINLYDQYRSRQAKWLEGVLKSEMYLKARHRVIVGHVPPFGGWHGNKEIEEKFMPLLRSASPSVMLCGHMHKYVKKDKDVKTCFPIIVNSNKTILVCSVSPKNLKINVINEKGEIKDSIELE